MGLSKFRHKNPLSKRNLKIFIDLRNPKSTQNVRMSYEVGEQKGGGIMNDEKIRVLVVIPGMKPEERYIPNDLQCMHTIVGGYIETVFVEQDICAVGNDEGMFLDLPLNHRRNGWLIYGTFILAQFSGSDLISLTDEQIECYKSLL